MRGGIDGQMEFMRVEAEERGEEAWDVEGIATKEQVEEVVAEIVADFHNVPDVDEESVAEILKGRMNRGWSFETATDFTRDEIDPRMERSDRFLS